MPITIRASLAIAAALAALTSASLALAAGNVTVSVRKGNLFITGDEEANVVGVDQDCVGDVNTFCIYGWSINGEAHIYDNPLIVRGVTGDFNIKLAEGDDSVYLNEMLGMLPGSVRIDAGKGNDFVRFLDAHASGDLRISMGPGNDTIDFRDTSSVDGNLLLEAGSGDDAVTNDNDNGDFFVGGWTHINMGPGNDWVGLMERTFLGPVHLRMSGGDDRVSLTRMTFKSQARLEGGNGLNRLRVGNRVRFSVEPEISRFEVEVVE